MHIPSVLPIKPRFPCARADICRTVGLLQYRLDHKIQDDAVEGQEGRMGQDQGLRSSSKAGSGAFCIVINVKAAALRDIRAAWARTKAAVFLYAFE